MHADTELVRWVVVDPWTWAAQVDGETIGTVQLDGRWLVRLRHGDVSGSHTSLESAKAQLEAWARWQVRSPWGP
ncbi:hypothetical protein ACRQ4B_11100 [Curtobacterium sp. SP.BCo]|uniref:hypothetical protein n=1 Tax=Curtobacterium sp. SP.BCo TaxID=3435229 RepID=UPI003F735696